MGLTCCTQRESQSDYLEEVKREMDQKYMSSINIKLLVNMIPLAHRKEFKQSPKRSIKVAKSQSDI